MAPKAACSQQSAVGQHTGSLGSRPGASSNQCRYAQAVQGAQMGDPCPQLPALEVQQGQVGRPCTMRTGADRVHSIHSPAPPGRLCFSNTKP